MSHAEKTRKVYICWTVDVRLPEAGGPCTYRHCALEERRVREIVEIPPKELAPKRSGVRRRRHGDHARRVVKSGKVDCKEDTSNGLSQTLVQS